MAADFLPPTESIHQVHQLKALAASLKDKGLKGMSDTNLKLFRQFYLAYPQISQPLSDQLLGEPAQRISFAATH